LKKKIDRDTRRFDCVAFVYFTFFFLDFIFLCSLSFLLPFSLSLFRSPTGKHENVDELSALLY